MEVIVYPSGQLLKGANGENPPKSTIGPRLEAALRNSFYRNQGRMDALAIIVVGVYIVSRPIVRKILSCFVLGVPLPRLGSS